MSFAVSNAIWASCLFRGNRLLMMLALADWADDNGGSIFPGMGLVAAKCQMSVRTAQGAIKALCATRTLVKVANASGGRGRRTEYRIDLQRMQELQDLHE